MIEDKELIDTPDVSRILCKFCNSNNAVACFKIIDSWLCLYCFDKIKKLSGLDIDKIHELNSIKVKEYLLSVKVKESPPAKIEIINLPSLPTKEQIIPEVIQPTLIIQQIEVIKRKRGRPRKHPIEFKISSDGTIIAPANPSPQENLIINGPNRQSKELSINKEGLRRRPGRPKKVMGGGTLVP